MTAKPRDHITNETAAAMLENLWRETDKHSLTAEEHMNVVAFILAGVLVASSYPEDGVPILLTQIGKHVTDIRKTFRTKKMQ